MQDAILIIGMSEPYKAFFTSCFSQRDDLLFACDAKEAQSLLLQHTYNVSCMLLDISGDCETGFDFLERTKELPERLAVPCFALADLDDTHAKHRALSLGVDDFIYAPLDAKIIGARLRSALSGAPNYEAKMQYGYQKLLNKEIHGGILSVYVEDSFPIHYISESLARYLGYDDQLDVMNACNGRWENLIYPEDVEQTKESLRTQLAATGGYEVEYRLRKKNGDVFWTRDNGIYGSSENGSQLLLCLCVDMTTSKLTEEALRRSEHVAKYHQHLADIALANTGISIWEYDFERRCIIQYQNSVEMHGFESIVPNVPESLVNSGFVHPDSAGAFTEMYNKLFAGESFAEGVFRVQTSDRKGYWFEHIRYTNTFDEQGRPYRAVGMSNDETDKQEAIEKYKREQEMNSILSPDVQFTAVINLDKKQLEEYHAAANYTHWDGLTIDNIFKKCAQMVSDNQTACAYFSRLSLDKLIEVYNSGERKLGYDFLFTTADQGELWFSLEINLICDPETSELHAFIYIRDIDEKRREHDRLLQLAQRDGLTGLLNHGATHRAIKEFLRSSEGRSGVHALLMLDLDGFKAVNDTNGHHAGDMVLAEVGRRLRGLVREQDIIGRVGGDEFMVLLKDVKSEANTEGLLAHMHRVLGAPFSLDDGTAIIVKCSIGCSMCYASAKSFDVLYPEADSALYHTKRTPSADFMFYSEDMLQIATLPTPIDRVKGVSAPESEKSAPRALTVLIADDSIVNRKLLRKVLTAEGYNIVEAENGVEALEQLRSDAPADLLILDIVMPELDGYGVLKEIRNDPKLSELPILVATVNSDGESQRKAFEMGASDYILKPYSARTVQVRVRSLLEQRRGQLLQQENDALRVRLEQQELALKATEKDLLTGIYSYNAFVRKASEMIWQSPAGSYVLSCFDIDDFKVVNDQYGRDVGDRLLRHLAFTCQKTLEAVGGICGRISADNFTALYPRNFVTSQELIALRSSVSTLEGTPVNVVLSIGRYIVEDTSLSVEAMMDRASLAKETVKGRYDNHCASYTETLRENMLSRQEIVSQMDTALSNGQFEVWLQPQYSHQSGERVGAEALVRWRHPERGLIAPGEFIPIFEQNGFVYELDRFVWRQTALLLRRWLDEGKEPLPISINISRYDIYQPDFFEYITGLIEENSLPIELLRLEITESAFSKSTEQIIAMVEQLRDYGFYVEIDDFGSGYSSLNTLKDVPANILKLDIRFLEGNTKAHRGGRILESVIRMAKWLDMPVIAEGVETIEQADYLRTLGCDYIQGFLYAKPLPVEEYERLPAHKPRSQFVESGASPYVGSDTFWNPDSIETLVFNRFSGGACVFELWNGHFEMLRVNEKFAPEFRSGLTEREILAFEPLSVLDEADRETVLSALDRAIKSGAVEDFELCSSLYAQPQQKHNVRFSVRLIASSSERYLFYAYVENISDEQHEGQRLSQLSRKSKG